MANSKKINVTLNETLLAKVDLYCQNNGLTRSGFLGVASSQYLNAIEQAPKLNNLIANMNMVFAKGTFTEDEIKALEQGYNQIKLG